MSPYDHLAESLSALSGTKVTADDVRQRLAQDAQLPGLTASEIMALHPPLSGSHIVTTSTRVTGWAPQPRPDWKAAAWLRDEHGRFRALGPDEVEHDQ